MFNCNIPQHLLGICSHLGTTGLFLFSYRYFRSWSALLFTADTQVQVPGIARRAMDTIKYLLVLQETIVLEMGVFLIHMAL